MCGTAARGAAHYRKPEFILRRAAVSQHDVFAGARQAIAIDEPIAELAGSSSTSAEICLYPLPLSKIDPI
jgi:hypothetical protein